MKVGLVLVLSILIVAGMVCTLLNYGQVLAQNHYNNGVVAGERTGFDKGYIICYNNLGLWWIDHAQRFKGFVEEFGSIHNTPWDKFAIEEKATIAMYGGSGSKLEQEEVDEWVNKYGVEPCRKN